jgi:hypothetical protein
MRVGIAAISVTDLVRHQLTAVLADSCKRTRDAAEPEI